MRARLLSFGSLALAAVLGFAACRERGRPDPSIRMAVSHAEAPPTGGDPDQGLAQSVPTRLVVPPEVTAAYSAIRLEWRDSETGQTGTVEVPIGGAAPLPGSDLEVRADVFLPSFSMSADEITSTGTGQENPAARIAVAEKGNEIFAGWIFTRFPEVHPFQHARFSLKLEGGVARKDA